MRSAQEGVDVAVRIGIHTGVVTGGIIGTVRFHFDMWGSGVNGAVKMEEMGERFRVHISNATHDLVTRCVVKMSYLSDPVGLFPM